jgi:hypothetical protein
MQQNWRGNVFAVLGELCFSNADCRAERREEGWMGPSTKLEGNQGRAPASGSEHHQVWGIKTTSGLVDSAPHLGNPVTTAQVRFSLPFYIASTHLASLDPPSKDCPPPLKKETGHESRKVSQQRQACCHPSGSRSQVWTSPELNQEAQPGVHGLLQSPPTLALHWARRRMSEQQQFS